MNLTEWLELPSLLLTSIKDQPHLWLLSIAPGLLIAFYIYYRDRHDREPLIQLALCFLFGMLSTQLAIPMESYGVNELNIGYGVDQPFMTFLFAFGVIAFSEEFVKFLFLRSYIFNRKAFDEPMDGIVYSVMISMGFATLENVLYVVYRSTSDEDAISTGLARMFTAVPAHAIFAIIMGYFVGLAKFTEGKQFLYLFYGFCSAWFLHGVYDYFLFMEMSFYLVIYTLILGVFISRNFIVRHLKDSPYKEY